MTVSDAVKGTVAKFIVNGVLYSDDATQLEKQWGAYALIFMLNGRVTDKYEQAKLMKMAVDYSKKRMEMD